MAEVDTSIYPKAQNNLLDSLGNAVQTRNALIQGQRQQVGLSADKINLAHQQYGQLSQFLGSLAQDPRMATDQGPALLHQATQQAVQQGWITPDIANVELSNMPSNPAQIPQYLQNLNVRVQDAAGQFSQIYGTPGTISNGSQTLPVTTSPLTGIRPIGAPITQTLTPEARATLVPGTNSEGQPTVTPTATVLQNAGLNPLTVQPQSAPSGPANRLVPFDQNNPPPQPKDGSVVTGASPGSLEANKAAGVASGQQLASDRASEANFQSDVTPLIKARDALIRLGPTGSGPGTEQINEIKSFAQSMGLGPLAGIDPEKIQNFDEARKYLVQYASQAGNTGTNDKLAAAFAGNPNMNISNAAAVDVLKTALSLRRLQNAKVQEFDATGQQPSAYSRWATQFNSKQDPVAYGFDMMSPEQRQKYFSGLSGAARTKFIDSLQAATRLGLVAPPGAAQ